MLLRGLDRAEECIAGADLGKARSKTHLDVDYGHARSTSMIENICGSNQKSVFGLSGVDRNDAGLTIHAQDGRVGGMNRKRSSHIKLPSAQNLCRSEFSFVRRTPHLLPEEDGSPMKDQDRRVGVSGSLKHP
jgi:hypothetical protein